MREQMDLFEGGRFRSRDPSTSREAADSITANRLELIVVKVIAACPLGATCGEIVEMTGLEWNTVSPRLAPLREKGLIRVRRDAEGNKVRRPGRKSKRSQLVWEVPHG